MFVKWWESLIGIVFFFFHWFIYFKSKFFIKKIIIDTIVFHSMASISFHDDYSLSSGQSINWFLENY